MTHYYRDVQGWFKFRPAYDQLLAALPATTPSTFVEIGLWLGRSTAYLGVEILNQGKPVTILAIDHFKGQPEIIGWRAALVEGSEAAFRQNIATVAEALGPLFQLRVSDSVAAAAQVADDSVEVVWLDAEHSVEAVRADIEAWWPKVRVGGFIGGDDYRKCVGVRQAVLERWGIQRDLANHPHYWLMRRQPDGTVESLT